MIKEEAKRLGFFYCGISKSDFLEEEAPRLENWLKSNMHGNMHYMENHFDKRLDTRLLVPDSKSVISLLFNYYADEKQPENAPKISKYAWGEDYHTVIKDKLKELFYFIHLNIGEVSGRVFVDSAPVLDKAWAKKSGLGWIGKNSNLINKQQGSFFFIAELILDLELDYDGPIKDYCGSCTKCIDACPTEAIIAPYKVDGSKCISYFTIELRDQIPDRYKNKFTDWAFGCDVCQDVCPWNRFSKSHQNERLKAKKEILSWEWEDWKEISGEIFSKTFKDSPLSRAKYEGIKRNLDFLRP